MRTPKKRGSPKPRNVAAKALARPEFRPKVAADPNAYRRRPRHKPDLTRVAEGEELADKSED